MPADCRFQNPRSSAAIRGSLPGPDDITNTANSPRKSSLFGGTQAKNCTNAIDCEHTYIIFGAGRKIPLHQFSSRCGHARSQTVDKTAEARLRIHSRQDSQPRLRPDGPRDRREFRHQLAQRRDVPPQGARKEGADHSRAEYVAGDPIVLPSRSRIAACRWPGGSPPACCTKRSSRPSGSISRPCSTRRICTCSRSAAIR